MKTLTQQELKRIFNYDKNTGVFTWKIKRQGIIQNSIAGALHKYGYIVVTINGKTYKAHRLAWLFEYGELPKNIDHINHKRNDNRISNLRNVSRSENQKNLSKRKDNKTGVTGISWSKEREMYVAQIQVDGAVKFLGRFKDFDEAVLARKKAEKQYKFHKNHGKTND